MKIIFSEVLVLVFVFCILERTPGLLCVCEHLFMSRTAT